MMRKCDLKRIKKKLFITIATALVLSTVSFGVMVNPSFVSAANFTHGGGILYTQADFDRANKRLHKGLVLDRSMECPASRPVLLLLPILLILYPRRQGGAAIPS